MPNVLPTIPNDPPQGIQALLDKVYLWNPDVSNELIGKINELLEKFGDVSGAIKPYSMLTTPVMQYAPCYYGSGVYVAARELNEIPMEFNEADWILIATKGVTAEEVAETYLPLSGGTLTGTLRTMSVIPSKSGPDYALGSDLYKWQRIYVRQISNSSTITVPTKSGTMARLEDLTGDNVSVTFAGQDDTVQNAINTLKTDQDELGDQVSAIESKIPADASETNQLVTKNEVLALPTFTYMVVNELPETGEEKIIYLVPKAGEGNDVHDEYIWVNGGYELIGTTAVDLSGYLPLTGGEMTGLLTLNAPEKPQYGFQSTPLLQIKAETADGTTTLNKIIQIAPSGSLGMNGLNISGTGSIYCAVSGNYDLGIQNIKWRSVYATKLNNGADIAIPTTGGTIALKEDIAESVTTKDLTVGTDEGTLNIGITAGVATIATNNGLDIVSQTKFDTAPTTDDATAWADVNATALVTKAQVTAALSTAGGGASLPDQTGNAGKFLKTDGTTASWGDALVNVAENNQSLVIDGTTVGPSVGSVVIGHGSVAGNDNTSGGEVVVGVGAKASTSSFSSHGVAVGNEATTDSGIAIGWYSKAAGDGIAIGRTCDTFARGVAIGNSCVGSEGTFSVSLGKIANYNTTYYTYTLLDNDGNVPRERLKNLVEVLPTADNGYTTVKNFGNGYVEITGYASIGTVGAGTGSEVQIDLPAGYTMANANYWVNIAPTSETTMFDFKAEAKARSTTHFMVAYKNEDSATGLTAAGVYWEVRGMLATA